MQNYTPLAWDDYINLVTSISYSGKKGTYTLFVNQGPAPQYTYFYFVCLTPFDGSDQVVYNIGVLGVRPTEGGVVDKRIQNTQEELLVFLTDYVNNMENANE